MIPNYLPGAAPPGFVPPLVEFPPVPAGLSEPATGMTWGAWTVWWQRVFDLLVEPEDWKRPVDKLARVVDLSVSVQAIALYTGTPRAVEPWGPTMFRVRSVGYRAGPDGA
jgi:hypothetical protein